MFIILLNLGRFTYIIISIITLGFLSACTGIRQVPDGKIIVRKNKLEFTSKNPAISSGDLSVFLPVRAQKGRLFGGNWRLWLFYKTDSSESKIGKWLHEEVSVEPSYFDWSDTEKASQQMKRFLSNKGFFYADVTFDTLSGGKKKVRVQYQLDLNKPYIIREFNIDIQDTALKQIQNSIFESTLIEQGMIYDSYIFNDERTRIAQYLQNQGYYFFNREYILYEVDSSLGNQQMRLTLKILPRKVPVTDSVGKFSPAPHKQYHINQVNIIMGYDPIEITADTPFDSVTENVKQFQDTIYHQFNYFFRGSPLVRPSAMNHAIMIENNEVFNLEDLQLTYRRLSNYRIFRYTNILFDTNVHQVLMPDTSKNWLDCEIQLQRAKKQAYTVELEGTNSGGDFGIRGNLLYLNKNIFKGSELFRLRLKGGVVAQKIFASSEEGLQNSGLFNRVELGVDGSVFFPRFLSPIRLEKFRRIYQPKTNITASFTYQNQIDYTRYLSNLSFGYDWKYSDEITHIFFPLSLSFIKIYPSPEFQEILDKETNQRLKNQYTDHLLLGMKYSFIYNNQNLNKYRNFTYFRANVETSGNTLYAIDQLFNSKKTENYYELLGIRYAQFLRLDVDFRYYYILDKEQQLVSRFVAGIGLPYGNSEFLPFENGFFSGGANGMRGWRFRGLGPGSYAGATTFERVGDIQLEANFEYRFPFYKQAKLALFTDIGNIWNLKETENFPGGEFSFNTFLDELAVDMGVGLRLDFSFFIIRLDGAIPIRKPSNPSGERWVINKLRLNEFILNLGIGYPF